MSLRVSLKDRASAELELRRRQKAEIILEWPERLQSTYPRYLWHELSQPHRELWEWVDAVEIDTAPRPFIAIWPRGRGKSTHAEIAAVDLGARHKRNYCMYVCGTQDQADKHIATITNIMESDEVSDRYPHMSNPKIGKNGSRSWNRKIVTTSSRYTVEAVGLNKAVRGQKIDWARPDFIIFDDIDERHDTENTVKKKRTTIRTSILPAGATNAMILFGQNLIHSGSIAHELSKTPGTELSAKYLMRRIISGPHKAVEGLEYELYKDGDSFKWMITAGKSLWKGFDLEACENEINNIGPTSFEVESQHDIEADNPNALLSSEIFESTRVKEHPDLITVGVGVDPSGGAGQCGIIGAGKAKIGREYHGFTIADYSTPYGTPSAKWGEAVLKCYHSIGADYVVVERNFGGDMATATIRNAEYHYTVIEINENGEEIEVEKVLSGKNIRIIEVTASRGKEVRAQPIATLFELGKAHHVGEFPRLEKEWTSWEPGDNSPDRLDAEVWIYTHLGISLSASSLLGWAG